jgi:hypothetical protein
VPCLAGRCRGKTSTSRVGDARAGPGVGDARASLGVGDDARTGSRAASGSFATHFTTVFNAATTALLAFA